MRKIISMLLTVLLAVGALAQTKTKTVKGVVYEEETGQTLPGATVSVVGSTRGVIADLDGAFEISGVKSTDQRSRCRCLWQTAQRKCYRFRDRH